MNRLLCFILLGGLFLSPCSAQQGDKAGHEMAPPPEAWNLPAPFLRPDEALASFRLAAPGFVLERVAAEPLVIHPVAIAFDGNGRPWVCEMRGYMPDVDGRGEEVPNGRISILLDLDGDGQADEAKVFLDGLVLPRALQFVRGGILWGDGEKLHFTGRTGEGGLEAGETTVVDENWAPVGNVEHKPNGLAYGLDNWLYTAKSDWRYRFQDGKLARERSEFRGQWGVAQDDQGRLHTNTNSNLVSMEVIPPGYSLRNPNHRFSAPLTVKIANEVFPIRITCGVNRGYLAETLDERGHLRKATASGGPTVYRGDNFPAEYRGNLFIPEPAGLLVKRAILSDGPDGLPSVRPAYPDKEFIASLDERNRFVNAHTAPDGTLYLVDLYHGIVQHRAYVTSYLRDQILRRGLDKDNEGGRIYRVRWSETPRGPLPRMEDEPSSGLVARLGHPNGWWRDTAQRLLVERGDLSVTPALHALVADTSSPVSARVHALWTLEGLGALEPDDIRNALAAPEPSVAAQGCRVAERLAGTPQEATVAGLLASVSPSHPAVTRQLAAALGGFRGPGREHAEEALLTLLASPAGGDRLTKDLAMSGLGGMETEFLARALPRRIPMVPDLIQAAAAAARTREDLARLLELASAPALAAKDRSGHLTRIAQSVAGRRNAVACAHLISRAEDQPGDEAPILQGFIAASKAKGFKRVPLSPAPALFAHAGDDPLRRSAAAAFDLSGQVAKNYLTTPELRKLHARGKVEYSKLCATCHHVDGIGMATLAPPLVDSEWVLGPEKRLVALVMDGLMGPITVNGTTYEPPAIQPVMPGLRFHPELDDEALAGIMTYIRNTWEHAAPPVLPGAVQSWRDGQPVRAPFSPEELLSLP